MRIFICRTIIQNQRLFAYANGYDYSSCITLYDGFVNVYRVMRTANIHITSRSVVSYARIDNISQPHDISYICIPSVHLHYNLILTPQNIISCVSAPRSKSLYAVYGPTVAVYEWAYSYKGSEYEYGWFILLYLLFGVCYATRCRYVRFAHLITVNEPILCE